MENITDFLINSAFQLTGLDKAGLKSLFEANGLMWLWVVLRDYVFDYKVWVMGVLPAFLLQLWKPVFRMKKLLTPQLVLDALYPILGALFSVLFVTSAVVAVVEFYDTYLPFLNTGLLDDKPAWVQGLGAFLITDLMFYISHRALHEVRWFWHFHTIHHSQTDLNPLTSYRTHPVQKIINTIIRTIPIGVVGGEPTTWIVFLILNNFWGYFIHSNIRVNLGFLKYIIVTPQYHRVHHSIEKKHFDKNYGERLIIWDWLFGSMYKGFDDYPATGVPKTEWIMAKSFHPLELLRAWASQMVYPFVMVYRSILSHWPGRRVTE